MSRNWWCAIGLSALLLSGMLIIPGSSGEAFSQDDPPPATGADTPESNAEQALPAEQVTENGSAPASESETANGGGESPALYPLVCLAVGIITVVGLIIALRLNAFISLIAAAIVVSLMAPGDVEDKIGRVAAAFGSSAGSIGIVIAMAAVIGKCMLDSGAADRIVRAFLNLMGEKRSPLALMGSGFVLAVPVFFDTVFYLLVPLARSLHTRTGLHYLKYIMAIAAGGAITHTLVPPTPGPLLMASNLGFDVGIMILVGGLVAVPAAIAGLLFASWADRVMPVPMRPLGGEIEQAAPPDASKLPSLFLSVLPVALPVVLISTNTVLTTIADNEHAALLEVADIRDFAEFRQEVQEDLQSAGPSPGKRLLEVLRGEGDGKNAQRRAEAAALLTSNDPLSTEEREKLIQAINTYVLPDKQFYEQRAFVGVLLNDTAEELLGQNRLRMKQAVVERMNRAILESAYNMEATGGIQKRELIREHTWETPSRKAANISALFGDANLALLLSAAIAIWVLVRQRGLSRTQMAAAVENSLMSGGVIILITAAGGAFGAMLNEAGVGEAMKSLFEIDGQGGSAGIAFLTMGFLIATVLKIAQGSSTVAMITGSGMLAGIAQPELLGFHPVYLATAIGAGSLMGSWMNDSGFWIFAKMGGLTEAEALKSWSVMLCVLGLTSFAATILLSMALPLV